MGFGRSLFLRLIKKKGRGICEPLKSAELHTIKKNFRGCEIFFQGRYKVRNEPYLYYILSEGKTVSYILIKSYIFTKAIVLKPAKRENGYLGYSSLSLLLKTRMK